MEIVVTGLSIALTISALMVVGLIGLRRWGIIGESSADQRSSQMDSAETAVPRIAILLGVLAIVASCATGYFAFRASRGAMREAIIQGHLDVAQVIAWHADGLPSANSDILTAKPIRHLWQQLGHSNRKASLCVVRSDGTLLQHTSRDKLVGTNVGDLPVETGRKGGPKTIRALVTAGEDWVGDFTSGEGELQVAACAYVPRLDSMVIIHTPVEEINAAIVASVVPWIGGLAVSVLLLIPLSLGLLYWAHTVSMRYRDRAARALRESQSLYQSLVEHIPQMIFRKDLDGRMTFACRRLCETLNRPLEDVLGRMDFDFYPTALARKYRADDVRVIETGEVFDAVEEHRAADGQLQYVRVIKLPIRDAEGQIVGIQGIFWDITERQQTQMALQESEARLREAQKVARIGSFEGDIHSDELWWSDELYHLFGLEPASYSPSRDGFTALLHPDDEVEYIAALMSSLESGERFNREFRAKHTSGEWRHFETVADVTFDDTGEILGLRGTVQDITERVHAEKTQRESDQRFRRAIADAPIPIMIHAEDGEVLQISKAWSELTGYPHEDIPTVEAWSNLAYGADQKTVQEVIQRLFELTERVDEGDFQITTATGETRVWNFRTAPLGVLPDGRRIVTSMATDVTAKRRAEQALRDSEEKYRVLVESSPYCIHQIDRHGQMVSMNRVGLQMIEEEDESAIIGVPYLSAVCEEDRERISNLMDAAFDGEFQEFEFRGTVGLEFRSNFVPIRDTNGKNDRLLGITQDITERKQVEEALRHSAALLSKAQEIAHIGSFEWDVTRDRIICSDELLQIYGINRDDFGGSIEDVMPLIHPDDRGRLQEGLEQALKEGTQGGLEYRIVRPDGSVRTVFGQAEFLEEADETSRRLIGFVQDVTQRKRAEEALNALLLVASEVTGDAFFECVVEMLTDVLGVSDAFIGELVKGDPPKIRTIARRSDNQSAANILYDLPGTPCETVLGKTIQVYRGNLWEQFPQPEVLRVRGIRSYIGAPIFSQTGKPIGVLCGMSEREVSDLIDSRTLITLLAARCGAEIERRNAVETLHNQQAALAHADRVASVGELSSGIVHELSQPLYAVSNFSGACRRILEGMECEGSSEVAGYIDRITLATQTAQEIITQLRDFLKRQDVRRVAVDLDEAVQEVLKLLAFEIRSFDVTVECDLASGTTVFANAVQLQQVLVNLIVNACEALDAVPVEGRRILIRTSNVENRVEVTVQDNGMGVSEEAAKYLFEPFFTTKAKGLGLGMMVSRNIISDHDGKIWFTSPPHQGAVFHFTLPVFQDS